ncbi:hypothetical protein JZO77_24190 [Enterococcus hulanensis]|uniref:hypothetical protein n=1 Tax=Enterococcus hulanensis TaxID=2559929 RepID=UPI001A8F71EE|nr:hypothetical protein [Enterococcus hulanensis]MBO0459833.1 hypothetical protein [Enterococcus hulanensis]
MFYSNTIDDRISVIIDGFPSDYWHICLTERPSIPTPERQVQVDEILGKMGSFYTKFGYNDMTVDLTFNFLEDVIDYKSWKSQFPHVRKWLSDGHRLEFSDDKGVYYIMHNVLFGKDVLNDMIEYGEFTVTAILAPFARVQEDEPIDLLPNGEIPTYFQTKVFNASIENSYPIIKAITANRGFVFAITDSEGVETVLAVYPPSTGYPTGQVEYTVDCERKLMYYKHPVTGALVYFGDIEDGDEFPILPSGESLITFNGNNSGNIKPVKLDLYRNMLR